jgi:hypothetical protein
MDDNTYELAKIWKQLEENFVQSVNLDPEMNENDNTFDFNQVKAKLDGLYKNVGKSAQSAEFAGNDVWLVTGKYPLSNPGDESILIYANDDVYRGSDTFDLFKRVLLPSTEYEDITIESGSIEEILSKAQEINAGNSLKEVDSPDEAIERRDREERSDPMDKFKTLKLDGRVADLLDMNMKQFGTVEWTDGYQGDGPYLPKEVEDYILNAVGNDTEEPFSVSFIKYGSTSPLEGKGSPIYVEYEQETTPNNHNKFGLRDMTEQSELPIGELHNLVKVNDLGETIDISLGIVRIAIIEHEEDGWSVYIQGKPLARIHNTKEEAFNALVSYLQND